MAQAEARYTITATDRTKSAMKSVRSGLKTVSSQVLSLKGAIAGLVGAAGFGALITMSNRTIDTLAKKSDQLEIATEKLGGLHAATRDFTSAGASAMDEALVKATKRLGEFHATGGGAAAGWIQKLNLDVQELANLSPDQLFNRYAEAVGGLNDRGQQLAAMSALMGDESRQLIGLVDAGTEAIEAATEEAIAYGTALNRVDAAKVEAANDAFGRVQDVITGISNRIAVQLAPYLEAVANMLADAARESNGWSEQIISGLESIGQGVAFVGDVFRGLHVVWKGLELAFAKLAEFIWMQWRETIGRIMESAEWIPYIGENFAEAAAFMERASGNATARVDALAAELDELVLRPMPSQNIEAFFDQVRVKADEAAEKVAESRARMGGGLPEVGGGEGSGEVDEAQQQRLEKLRSSFRTEMETLQLQLEEKQEFLLEADERLFESEHERNEMLYQIQADHNARMQALEESNLTAMEKLKRTSWSNQAQTVLGNMADMTAGVAQGNRAMFEINKVAALAEGALSLKKTVMDAYEWGTAVGGPVLGAAYAAIAGGAQAANLAQIAGTSFGAGGAAPSVGGTAAPPVTPIESSQPGRTQGQEEQRTGTTIQIIGDVYGMDDFGERVSEVLRERINDSDDVLISRNSRQARELGVG